MESWKRKLRMGMVGGGQGAFIGGVHRIAATLDQQVEFVAGCFSRDPVNTKLTGEQLYLDPSRCYPTYQEMAEKESKLPEDQRIDFVSVVTPNVSHFAIAKTFLDAGFHIVCEKPMTYSLEEAIQLAKLVRQRGLVFGLIHNYTGHPMVRQAREMFRAGEMGIVWKVLVEYLQDFLMTPVEKLGQKQAAWRVDPAQAGVGGTLGDIGTHCFSLVEYVSGDIITEMCADKMTHVPGRKLDDDANILLRFKSGAKGVLTVSQAVAGEDNGLSLRVYASKGAVLWAQEEPDSLKVYRHGQPRQVMSRGHGEYLSEAASAATRLPVGHPEGYLEAFANIYRGAVEAIRRHVDGKPISIDEYTCPNVYDGLRDVQFVAKAVESADAGSRWVSMEPLRP